MEYLWTRQMPFWTKRKESFVIGILEDARTLVGVSLPGTQSKCIYSYDLKMRDET